MNSYCFSIKLYLTLYLIICSFNIGSIWCQSRCASVCNSVQLCQSGQCWLNFNFIKFIIYTWFEIIIIIYFKFTGTLDKCSETSTCFEYCLNCLGIQTCYSNGDKCTYNGLSSNNTNRQYSINNLFELIFTIILSSLFVWRRWSIHIINEYIKDK
jgi:hypothetical protein